MSVGTKEKDTFRPFCIVADFDVDIVGSLEEEFEFSTEPESDNVDESKDIEAAAVGDALLLADGSPEGEFVTEDT